MHVYVCFVFNFFFVDQNKVSAHVVVHPAIPVLSACMTLESPSIPLVRVSCRVVCNVRETGSKRNVIKIVIRY